MNVDWDLLADHLGGALDGTPEGAKVARLVATDPGWQTAAAKLSGAFTAVVADLRTLPSPSLPDDVAIRLEHALRSAPAVPDPAPGVPAPRPAAAPAGRTTSESKRPPGRPGRTPRRRRLARWGAGFAVVAGVAAFAGLGLSLLDLDQPVSEIASDGDDAGENADGPAAAAPTLEVEPEQRSSGSPAAVVVATGTEYDAPQLATGEPESPPTGEPGFGGADQPAPPPVAPEFGINTSDAPQQVPASLLRLWTNPQARAECLAMVRDSLEPAPVRIDTVDFARYEGEDALVIWLTTADGLRRAFVSGPECGTITAGPDLQYQTPVS